MGIYDRPYYREESSGGLFGGRSMVTNLILVNVAVFVIEQFFTGKKENGFEEFLRFSSELFRHSWYVWSLLTYGFLHEPNSVFHVGFNMFGLWFFGRELEGIYGPREFLRVYLTLIVMSGLIWLLSEVAVGGFARLVGASGGVMGIMVLWILHFPRRVVYIWGVLPLPAWAMGVFFLLMEFSTTSAVQQPGSGNGDHVVAHVAHLAGALFGFIYFRSGWNLGRLMPNLWPSFTRPRLRLHDPDDTERDLSRQLDRILEKIHREGETNLTKEERKILEEASRRYQRRRQ